MAQQLLKGIFRGKRPLGHDLHTDEISQARYYILSYLVEYPESGDTVEGIQWWLLDRWIKLVSP